MNDKGFTLIEMLVSLSILLMISIYIIPSLLEVLTERKNLSIRNEGNLLLVEQINNYYLCGEFEKTIELNGVEYMFYIKNNHLFVEWLNRENILEKSNYEIAF